MTRPTRRPSFAPAVTRLEDRTTPAAVGALDPSFGAAGKVVFNLGPSDVFNAVAVQGDGKILAAGTNDLTNGDFLIARLNPNGTLDPTFGTNGVRFVSFDGNDIATGLALLPDGRIVVGGYTEKGGSADFAAARLNPDGTDDTSFGPNGKRSFDLGGQLADRAYSVAVNATGRVYLAGTHNGDIAVLRLDEFGNLDRSYGTNGAAIVDLGGTDEGRSVVLYSDGTAVVAGFTDAASPAAARANDFVALRLASDGAALDFGFGNRVLNNNKVALIDFGGDDKAYAAALQPDGRIVLAGTNGGPTADFAVARLNPDGNLDSTFGTGGARRSGLGGVEEAHALAVQPDGRIDVAGFSVPEGRTDADFAVARLTATGADDPVFGGAHTIDFGGDDRAFAAALDPRSRVVLAGRTSADSAAGRVLGSVELSGVLLTSGTPDASGLQYTATAGGQFTAGPPFTVFPGFTGAVRVAAADITGDGVPDRIAGVGPGGGPQVAVFDGRTGGLVASFFAFEPSFTGGVLVSAGDFNLDGKADLVVTADVGGGPRVRVFDGRTLAGNSPAALADFLGIADANFRGGARPAVGDVNNDGTPDLIVAAGPGGGPRVAVFNGKDIAAGLADPGRVVPDFFVYESALRNGAFPAAGDVDVDGFADLVFGAGPGGAPRVRVLSGRQLLAAGDFQSVDAVVGLQIANFIAGDVNSRSGVTVTTKDVDGDNKADVVTGSGPGLHSEVRLYRGTTLLANPNSPNPDQVLDPYGTAVAAGVFVG